MDAASPCPAVAPKFNRRRLQLSVRAMLAVVTLLCVCLGIVSSRAERQRIAVADVERAGGAVGYGDYVAPSNEALPRRFLGRWLSRHYFDKALRVQMIDVQSPGEGLRGLAGLTSLKVLDLHGTRLDDAGLANLSGLTRLERLNMDGAPVTDAGLAHLSRLKKLRFLSLTNTRVNGDGLSHLSKLTELEWIRLGGTMTTDAGLLHLSGLARLRIVELAGTQVTDAGVVELRRALPTCGLISLQPLPHLESAPPEIMPVVSAP